MAIQFHEGLSGSGKSYEAVVKQILPKIKEGRLCVTNIRGMNHQKIADILEMKLEDVQNLLIQLEWNDTLLVPERVVNLKMYRDAYIVLDEIQDFYPADRQRLDHITTEFITQHRQFGIDILLMGQSLKDVHALWRRRIQLKIFFINKEPVGKPKEYVWQSYMQTQPDKWANGDEGHGEYDEKYFGTYKSHHDEVSNTTQSLDMRGNIFNRKTIKYGLPAAALAFIASIYFLVSFFSNPEQLTSKAHLAKKANTTQSENNATDQQGKKSNGKTLKLKDDQNLNAYDNIIRQIKEGQFAYIGYYKEGDFQTQLLFELRDSSGVLISQLSEYELNTMGLTVKKYKNLVHITNNQKTIDLFISQTGTKPKGQSNETII